MASPRIVLLAGLLGLTACTDPFAVAQEADTIEAYEKYITENPDARFVSAATGRLETLLVDKAKAEASLEAYDAYLKRFPDGSLKERALDEREALLYKQAKKDNTPERWQQYLDEYPKAKKSKRSNARRMLKVHEYLPNLEIGAVEKQQVNLAEDPEGPLNGWEFKAEVTNKGPATISDLRITIEYLSERDTVLEDRSWPLVAEFWETPIEPQRKVAMKPGETRTWEWTTGNLPDGWDRKERIYVSSITLKK